jgi:carbon-monoxide dehydrogenase large subunit
MVSHSPAYHSSHSSHSPAVGQSVARAEDFDLLTGRARYVADLDDDRLAGCTHAVFVRSTHAHALITAPDTSAAARQPGVVGVFGPADLDVVPAGSFNSAIHPVFAQPLLAERKVRYAGEPVAVVVAESLPAAVDAAELVTVGYEPLEPVLDLDHSIASETLLFEPDGGARLQPAAPPEPPHAGGNVVIDTGWLGSDRSLPTPFDGAEVLVTHRAMNPRQSPAPIEPRAIACVWPAGGRLMVWAAVQRPHGFRDELCALYRLASDQLSVIAPDVGGGFGGKVGRTPEERLMPFLARATGRPVRWIETRSEYLVAAVQGRGERIDFTLAGTAGGRIEAVRAEVVKDAGAYPITGALLPANYTVPSACGPYAIAHAEIRARSVVTNRVATSAFRGAGRAPYLAGLEGLVDRYAATIGMDPADVRRRNLVKPGQMPYRTPTGAVYDEADYPADLDRALALAGYARLRVDQAERRRRGAVRQLGIGVACYNHVTVGGTGGGSEEACVSVLAGGRALVVTGSTSQGHGHRTTWAQLASDVLGIPVSRIEVVEGTTEAIATGVGAVGSRSLQTAGVAVHRAATEVVEQARLQAAELLEAAAADVVLDLDGGAFHVVGTPARAVTWDRLVTEAEGQGRELSCGDTFDNEGRNTFPSGTHVAVVEVDRETGAVQLVRYVGVDDAGLRVNPMIVEGQLHGGIASGVSQALGEEMRYDAGGNVVTSTFLDYQIGTADQLPFFELEASAVATSFNPLGVKGVGESGTIGATPAVHNAVLDALRPYGVEHLDLPCTPLRVWDALRRAAGPA